MNVYAIWFSMRAEHPAWGTAKLARAVAQMLDLTPEGVMLSLGDDGRARESKLRAEFRDGKQRKQYVRVPQQSYLDAALETGGGCVVDFAALFDVSTASARRMLDGLVAQGKMRASLAGPTLKFYEPVSS